MARMLQSIVLILILGGCQLPPLDPNVLVANLFGLINKASNQSISSIQLTADKANYQMLRRFEQVVLTTNPANLPIYFTIDGSEPSLDSNLYDGNFAPNAIAPGQVIKAKSILSSGLESNTLELRYLYPYLKTGQTVCYNFSTEVLEPCDASHTDQDGLLQKGHAIQYSSPRTNPGFDDDFITMDEVMGLTWTTCRLGMSGSNCNTGSPVSVTGENTNPDDLCNQLGTINSGSGFAGIQNWRVPNPNELAYLANFETSPILRFDSTAFPNLNNPTPLILHGVRNPNNSTQRFYYRINDTFYGSIADTNSNAVICVSGDSHPVAEYTDLGDGTIRDELRGLVWTKCAAGQTLPDCSETPIGLDFTNAINHCNGLNLAGRSWRLPSIRELETLSNPNEPTLPKIYAKDLFSPLIAGRVLRSSTSESATTARRFTVNTPGFSGGGAAALKTNNTVQAICVADEEWE